MAVQASSNERHHERRFVKFRRSAPKCERRTARRKGGQLRHTALQHRMDAMTSPVMGTVTRREFLMKAGAAALWVALPWKAAAQNAYPTRPVTIIVPFTPATGADVLARLLAPPLDARLKQPFV